MLGSTSARGLHEGLWRVRLSSAFRTMIACTVVAGTTLYGPEPVRHLLSYPAFSYVTTILIVSDATLGDTLRSCFHALYATVQVMVLSVLTLWMIEPARFGNAIAAVAVAVSAFVVALPESTPLLSKRIAAGQIVIVYVGAVIHGTRTGTVMHPVHVASSTAFGAFASILAMLLPFPRLATYEMRKTSRLYVENAIERLRLLLDAITAQDGQSATDFIAKSKLLREIGTQYLHWIKDAQEGMMWEKPHIRILKPKSIAPAEILHGLENMLQGMEFALISCPAFPASLITDEVKEALLSLKGEISLKLEQAKSCVPLHVTIAPDTMKEISDKLLSVTPGICCITQEALPTFFFLYCVELLLRDLNISQPPEPVVGNVQNLKGAETQNVKDRIKGIIRAWNCRTMSLKWEKWTFAIKCSLSLGFAVLFGLIFNKENGYWSGLTIAISFVTDRQATFTVANSRAQGTAMGSVYGVLCSFIFRRCTDFTFILLFPWIIFTTFLRHSRMYGQAGGISAVIGALLILGRKNYGSPSEFAIARLTEACIGLICFVMAEIVLQPARASTLAKMQLGLSLRALQNCIEDIDIFSERRSSSKLDLREKQKMVKSHIDQMEKFIAEAKLEPNFWFFPFQEAIYEKFLTSLRKVEDLLLFAAYDIETLSQISEKQELYWKELEEHINDDLGRFREKVCTSLRCLEEVMFIKSPQVLKKRWHIGTKTHDIESGKSQNRSATSNRALDNEVASEIVSSLLEILKDAAIRVNASTSDQKLKGQMMLSLGSLLFCISNLMKETREIEKDIKELLIMENHTMHMNSYEISCKFRALDTK